jgi:SAM-dependent methyltransferase
MENMKNSFCGWEIIGEKPIDEIADHILTNYKISEFEPDTYLYEYVSNLNSNSTVLDFGCGVGRNTYGLAEYSKNWKAFGYDNINMISKVVEYKQIKYPDKDICNAEFSDDWEYIKKIKFDCIFCALVLQHIRETFLVQYLNDFRNMTNRLLVSGRRFNDDMDENGKYKNTWKILNKCGFDEAVNVNGEKFVYIDGPPEEHTTYIYTW